MSADPFLSFAEITSAIRSKKLSAVEVLQVHLQRIERWQPKLNAFVHIDDEAARASARKIVGRPYEDELVLAVAEALENARGPWKNPPI